MKELRIFLLVFFLTIVVLVVGIREVQTEPIPCVDGRFNVNLEGIMCEGTEVRFFGHSEYWLFILAVPLLLTMLIIYLFDRYGK